MSEKGILMNLLLHQNESMYKVGDWVLGECKYFVGPFLLIGIITEFFGKNDFSGVVLRSIIALIAIAYFGTYHKQFVQESFQFGDSMIKKFGPKSHILKKFTEAPTFDFSASKEKRWDANETKRMNMDLNESPLGGWLFRHLYRKATHKVEQIVFADIPAFTVWLLAATSLMLLQQFYSLIFYFTYVFLGLAAVLSILPITSKSLTGIIKSSIWCCLTPIIVGLIIILVGGVLENIVTKDAGFAGTFKDLFQLFIVSVMLLMSPLLANKLINGEGFSMVAEKIGNMAAMSAMMSITKLVPRKSLSRLGQWGGGKIGSGAGLVGSGMGNIGKSVASTPGALFNRGRGSLSAKANSIREARGFNPTLKDMQIGEESTNSLGGKSDFLGTGSSPHDSASFQDKVILGADNLMNNKANKAASFQRQKLANALIGENPGRESEFGNKKMKLYPTSNDLSQLKHEGWVTPKHVNSHIARRPDNMYRSPALKDGETFEYNKKKWDRFSPVSQEKIKSKYAIQGNPKKGMVYFSRESYLAPVESETFHRNMGFYKNALHEIRKG